MLAWVALAVHSCTTKPSRTYRRLVENAMSGHVSKIAPMCWRTAPPSARSPAVWFSNTMSSACIDAIASRSWRFHASL